MKSGVIAFALMIGGAVLLIPAVIWQFVKTIKDGKKMNKPKTNRDVVNAMTDEEFVNFMYGKGDIGYKHCRVHWQDALPCRYDLRCSDCVLAWLKAPAGEHQDVSE